MTKTAWLGAAIALFSGCTTTLRYDPKYVAPPPVAADQVLDGGVVILTTAEDDGYVYSGPPTSFVGTGWTLVAPLGQITRDAALKVFGALFRSGAEAAPAVRPGTYRAIVSPRVARFSYAYGAHEFRPVVAIAVSVLSSDGRALYQRTYESPEGAAIAIPEEDPIGQMSRALQFLIKSMMVRAAADVRAALLAAPAE